MVLLILNCTALYVGDHKAKKMMKGPLDEPSHTNALKREETMKCLLVNFPIERHYYQKLPKTCSRHLLWEKYQNVKFFHDEIM